MAFPTGGEAEDGPAILRSRSWDPSQAHLNLSEFREASISPTRETLLLLSYQCEALLFPLTDGNSLSGDNPGITSCSPVQTVSTTPDLLDNIPCTSEPAGIASGSSFSPDSSSICKSYPAVCDVKSFAWGHCGDTYNQLKDADFRELLFVSGNHGVTVHAFRHPNKTNQNEISESFSKGEAGQGKWVEWSPSASAPNLSEKKPSSTFHDSPGSFWEADRTDRKGERSDDVCGESGCHESPRRPFTSKKWLRTFLTNVEMLESGGKFWTRFPGKASFPCFAEVVSFSIFDNASTFMEFILHTNPVSNNKENCSKITVLAPGAAASVNSDLTVTNSNDDSCNSSKLLSFDTNILYKCSRVFSSSSNRLVGFVLTLVDPLSVSKNEENERFWSKILLVVVLIHQWGIEWICSVKLHDTRPNLGSEFEWMDFQFSDTFLACLNASGLIFVYGATTGEFVACVDVLRICGLGPSPNVLKEEKLSAEGDISPRNANQSDQDDKQNGTFTKEVSYFCRKPLFKRLIVASRSSLFLAVDEYGVMYVFSISDFISDKYSLQKLAPSFQHFGLGVLFGWEIGASEIGCQKVVSNLSNFHSWNDALRNNETSPSAAGAGYNKLLKKENGDIQGEGFHDDSFMTGFSAIGQIEDHSISCKSSTFPMRRIFLPIDGYNEDDSLFFSPFGIIRLIKRCRIKDKHGFKLIDTCLRIALPVNDDGGINSGRTMVGLGREESFLGEAIGCSYQGCFYLVREDGVSVVLSSISILSGVRSLESLDYWRQHMSIGGWYQRENILERKVSDRCWQPWKLEVLDRVLLYEGPEEADNISLENGWDLKIARMRRLQLALDYLKYDEIQQSLEMLVDVNLAEEGILKLLFTAVYQIFCKSGSDNELALASRLLPLATHFATKMIRKYGLLQHKQDVFMFQGIEDAQVSSLLPVISKRELAAVRNSRRLCEMTQYLEIIRNLQLRLSAKRPGPNTEDRGDAFNLRDENLPQDTAVSVTTADSVSLEAQNQQELAFPLSDSDLENTEKLALMPMESLDSSMQLNLGNFREVSILASQGEVQGRKVFPLENPKDMIARWEMDNLDLKAVVKEALHSGRLPLAVLQLHLQRLKDLVTEKETHDTFTEVRVVGRAIAYDLFLKGETGLAVSTLQRLGEDVEISLKQLLFGTVRRSLRVQIAEEMKRYGYIGSYECKILECISVIERLYPSSSFWRTFLGRKTEVSGDSSSPTSIEKLKLQLICSYPFNDLIIECSEIDGVVLGSWTSMNECSSTFPVNDEDDTYPRYWVAAAVWSDAWDQRTIDRIVLDQPLHMGVYVLWESELEYHICHNNWGEVSKLLDTIPAYLLSDGNLHINLDGLRTTSTIGGNVEFLNYDRYICSAEELDAVCMDIPNIKIFRFPASNMCSTWMRMLMEQQLAKKFIFLKEYWKGTAEIVPLLARAGFIFRRVEISPRDGHIESLPALSSSNIGEVNEDAMEALHKLVIRYCAQHDLPNLLDLYLDHKKLVPDNDRLSAFLEAAGDCHWAKWLLLSRVKGHEYDASFSNARSIISRNVVPGNNLSVLEVDEIIRTVDDMAEGAEMAALATLMYAPAPIQKCLKSGSVNRHYSSSAQCTLENLRPALQRFPTLWRTLVAACFGQDTNGSFLGSNPKIVFGDSAFSDYLNWRENIFSSTGRDTSLVQMLPCWFSKDVRRLIQLFVQGPIGWQSLAGLSISESFLHRGINFLGNGYQNDEFSAISWEAAIQKNVEEELYASSLQETGFGVEHHLHRGRALAAFNHLISARVQKLKLANKYQEHSVQGQPNIQSDAQKLLAPVTQSEESLLSSVIPLAIMQFEDSVVVATCAFLLELCGLSAGMLRVDIAALRRISSYYKSSDFNEHSKHLLPNSSAFHALSADDDITLSLARALADDYIHSDSAGIIEPKGSSNMVYASKQPSHALLAVLQHLEKASLPLMVDGKTSGSWLLSGSGDGHESRSQQKAASQHWNLVTVFCQMHHIPPSTNYLAVLANDNDWVGFLTEAQVGGYPFEAIIQVASKEFNDPRLKIHILTVLKSMQSTRKKTSTSSISTSTERSDEMPFSSENSIMIPAELFGLLAECEKQKGPGEALLTKAKNLRWPLLAIIASCFPDVSPLYCLTVWLEITASRETSSIKVNDIASQIARNVGAAVEATNLLPAASRILASRYNRKNPKRRQLMEPASVDQLASTEICTSGVSGALHAQEIAAEDERRKDTEQQITVSSDPDEGPASLSKMVGVLCEKHLFLPLLRAFEMFLPSCSLLPFIRALQAFSQMRLSEASAHLASFSYRIKEETPHLQTHMGREEQIGTSWISSTAVKAAEAMLSTCPSAYEKRCLLQLLAATDFGDGGSAAMCFRRLYWKINLAEPSLRKGDDLYLGDKFLDDASLLAALEKNGHWEQARNWARQLEASGAPWKSSVHHVTETQAESMVAEWKEFLWDVPEERVALWGHCQTLFLRYSYPALQAGLFFLKHAEAVEKDVPARELHEMLLLSLQWLSGTITLSKPVYPLHLLREIETRVWLLAVESEAQVNCDGDFIIPNAGQNPMSGNGSTIIERTASMITKMDNHINAMRTKTAERHDMKESNQTQIRHLQVLDATSPATAGGVTKTKRRSKIYLPSRRTVVDTVDKTYDHDDGFGSPLSFGNNTDLSKGSSMQEVGIEESFSRWEERVGPEELERAVLSLLEFGQIAAAKQLQHKLSPSHEPFEFVLVDAALKLAAISTPFSSKLSLSDLDDDVLSIIESFDIPTDCHSIDPIQALENLATKCPDGGGHGLCKRIIAVVKAANVLNVSFSEAFAKQPIELLQLLSLKAQDSLEEAKLLMHTHSMSSASIAQILAESFLKGLLAAHRGGYMDSQKEEGPAPLLWRFSDFLKWAELCPSEPEVGHALMRLVITGQEIPHACEVELLILSHHFYKSSACLDGVDVLVALAATRVEAYVSEGDFACLARLVTGVGNFHALHFILGILIENGQLDLLLQKYSAADTTTGSNDAVRGFRMAVLTSLRHFNPHDLDAFAMVYNHFDMKHETASLLESRALQSIRQWFLRNDKDQNEDLLESMRYFIEAAVVHSTIDAGNKTFNACAQASLLSLQIRMPDFDWLNLSATNARRALVEQSRFQEALIVAEAYDLNRPSEWALAIWNHMLRPEVTEQFVAEFVAVLPLQPSMLSELAKFYRSEVAARGDQSHFSVWLSPGGLPAEWAKHLGRSYRCLLKRTRDLRLRLQLATVATGFSDVIDGCMKALDRVPDTGAPLVLRKGHGGGYVPLM